MTAQKKVYSLQFTGDSLKAKFKKTISYFLFPINSLRGFTLIELMIAISIVAIISAVGLVSYSKAQQLGRDARRKSDLQEIAKALQLYYNDNGRYPCAHWDRSNLGNPWLNDGDIGVGGTCATAKPVFNSNYISTLPVDPINTPTATQPWLANNYIYGYRAYNCNTNGDYYFLVAQLENPNDPDRVAVSHAKWCDGTDIYNHPASGITVPSTYVISSY